MSSVSVPDAPAQQVTVQAEGAERLGLWIAFFRELSLRIRILMPGTKEFEAFYAAAPDQIGEHKRINEDERIADWPAKDQIAFAVTVNSAEQNCKPEFKMEDVRIFCFGDLAFGPFYFNWDGDAEEGNWAKTWSLRRYVAGALTWDYNKSLIVENIRKLEKRVPLFCAAGTGDFKLLAHFLGAHGLESTVIDHRSFFLPDGMRIGGTSMIHWDEGDGEIVYLLQKGDESSSIKPGDIGALSEALRLLIEQGQKFCTVVRRDVEHGSVICWDRAQKPS